MKILFVSHSSVLKYHQQKLEILASKYNLDITLVMPPYWNEGGVKTPAYTGSPNIKYEIGKAVIFDKRMIHFYLNAAQIIKKISPDIVHVEEEPFAPACWQFIKAAKKYGKKTVFFTWENIERSHNPVYTYFDNYCIGKADAIIAGNEDGRQILLKKGFLGLLDVIPQYGVNIGEFKVRAEKKGRQAFNAAYIGRITPEKGIEILIKAVGATGSDIVRLYIAGTGDDTYIRSIHSLIDGLKLGEKIEFLGHVNRENMPDLLNRMDLLVLPSLTTGTWKEQFGRVIIEAFASKVPVIGSNSGEIPNVIGRAGIVFEEGNEVQLSAAIMSLVKDRELYNSCAENGFKRVLENYTNEIIADKLNNVYNKL
jgi:glycosyltransferase involved in cell wall biosynthesis